MHRIFLILLFLTSLWSNNPDFVGEKLIYSAGFRFVSAGEAILSFSLDSLEGKEFFKLTTSVKTNSFLDNFYEVRDEIQSWLNPNNLSLKKTIQKIKEGNYKSNFESIIKGDSIAVSKGKSRSLPGLVYDPIAFIYHLRNKKLSLNDKFDFFSFSKKRIRNITIYITAREKINVPAGTFDCLKIEAVSNDGKPLLKNDGEMKVWISVDSLRLPIKIEQKTNVGTMIMKLKTIQYSQ